MTEQFIFTAGGDALDRIERVGGYKAHLLGTGHGTEVFSEHIPPDVVFHIDSAKEWPGFEFIFVLEGELSYLGSDPHRQVRRGDYIARYLIEERSYFKTVTEVTLLHVCSPRAFHLMREEVNDCFEIARKLEIVESLDGHCRRLETLAIATGERLGLSGEQMGSFSYAAFLHDIGKSRVPKEVLQKPGKLTEAEWKLMRQHPTWGREILEEKDFLQDVAKIVEQTHERPDGQGYSNGLADGGILIEAKIIAAVDAFDVVTSDRPYRKARSGEFALGELQRNVGSQFDGQVVEALRQAIEQRGHGIAKFHEPSVPSQAVPLGHRSAFSMIAEHILSGGVCEQVLDNVATAITKTTLFAEAALLLFDRPYGGEAGRSIRINRAGFSNRERAEMPALIGEPLCPEDAKRLFDEVLQVDHSHILQRDNLPDAISRLFAMDSATPRSSGKDCFLVTPMRVGATKIIGLIIASARSGNSNLTQDVLSWSESVAGLVSAAVPKDAEKRKLRSRVEKLSQLAIRDPLTHLYNRRFLDEVVKREEARARRSGKPISLLMIDLVAFREVNNCFGHVVGDRVLKKAGAVMEKQLRKTDTIFRYGGDEFLVVMPEATEQQAKEISSRIAQAIGACDFGLSLALSLKTGIASWDPKAPIGFSTALERADRGLYQNAFSGEIS